MIEDAYEQDRCYICRREAQLGPDGGIRRCECQRCGRYGYDATEFELHAATDDILIRLAGYIQEQNRFNIEPVISLSDFRRIREMKLPSFSARSMKLLKLIYIQIQYPKRFFTVQAVEMADPDWLGKTFSRGDEDIELLMRILSDAYLLEYNDGAWALSTAGILKIEESESSNAASSQGFVAMSFSESLKQAWIEGFYPAISDAGFAAMRIDGKEYLGGISDEIIAEIRASSFVVADYTEQKNGVYYEAGFAEGLGLRVIPTVRTDEISKLHFDVKHLNTITWDHPADLRAKLSKRILAIFGRGPVSEDTLHA